MRIFYIKRISAQHLHCNERLENSNRYIGSNSSAFFCGCCSVWWTLASFMNAHQRSWSCDICLQFLISTVIESSESSHLIADMPICWVSGLHRVNFLQGFCLSILKRCSSNLNTLLWSLSLYLVHYIICNM